MIVCRLDDVGVEDLGCGFGGCELQFFFRAEVGIERPLLLMYPSGRVGALPLGGLAMLEACCFVGAAGGVAGAVRMSAGAR